MYLMYNLVAYMVATTKPMEVCRRSQWRIVKIIPVFLTRGRIFSTESVVDHNTALKFNVDQPHQLENAW